MALVVLPMDACPACGAPILTEDVREPALFVYGGYGATRLTRSRLCRCGWTLTALVTEVRPERGRSRHHH